MQKWDYAQIKYVYSYLKKTLKQYKNNMRDLLDYQKYF